MTANNHPAHGTVSLDRLHQISEILSKASAQSDGGNLGYAMADAVKVIDGVLALRNGEQKPAHEYTDLQVDEAVARMEDEDDMVLVPRGVLGAASGAIRHPGHEAGVTLGLLRHYSFRKQPEPEVPDTLPCPVHLEPGLKFGKGVRTQCVLDALRRRADYYAELEAMTPEQRAEHDSGIAEFKAMLGGGFRDLSQPVDPQISEYEKVMLQAGNSPVTPDTWIPVSERMPDKLIPVIVMYEDGEMWSAMWNGNRWDDGTEYPDPHAVTHWREMPETPQQE